MPDRITTTRSALGAGLAGGLLLALTWPWFHRRGFDVYAVPLALTVRRAVASAGR
jgi:hypothetical protein